MEIEEIIKSKQYFELSIEELDCISSYVSNEDEFDDMKSFLLSTQSLVESHKITTSKSLDKKVMNYLHHSYPQPKPWYNSLMLFLFPRGKQFYKYPAFQIVIASLFIFGVINTINLNAVSNDKMAFENVEKFKETTQNIEQKIELNLESISELEEEILIDKSSSNLNETTNILKQVVDVNIKKKHLDNMTISNAGLISKDGKSEIINEDIEETEQTNAPQIDDDYAGFDSETQEELAIESAVKEDVVNLETQQKPTFKNNQAEKSKRILQSTSSNLGYGNMNKFKKSSDSTGENIISIKSTKELFTLFYEVK